MKCEKKCEVCKSYDHHWLPNSRFGITDTEPEYECKHCGAAGETCEECDGAGCDDNDIDCLDCLGAGVLECDRIRF